MEFHVESWMLDTDVFPLAFEAKVKYLFQVTVNQSRNRINVSSIILLSSTPDYLQDLRYPKYSNRLEKKTESRGG